MNGLLVIVCTYSLVVVAMEMDHANQTEDEKSICFLDVGCFSLNSPWNTLWGYLPQDPQHMDIKYFLRNRDLEGRKELNFENINAVNELKPLVMIVHGFGGSSNVSWVHRLEAAFLRKEDVNVLSLDWRKGASGPKYFQAIANLRVVAAHVSRLLNHIVANSKGHPDKMHLVGLSLGAHLVSYVRINGSKVSHITGLDPAQPWFANKSPEIKLDKSDADFVVVIHTNIKPFWPSLGLGILEPAGHVDFYLNGGFKQPGCPKDEKGIYDFVSNQINFVINTLACSHLRSSEYLIEALETNCFFWGVKWNISSESFPSPKETICALENCQEMGKLTKLLPGRGSFYIKTNNFSPYCGNFFSTSTNILPYIIKHLEEEYFNLSELLD